MCRALTGIDNRPAFSAAQAPLDKPLAAAAACRSPPGAWPALVPSPLDCLLQHADRAATKLSCRPGR